MDQQHAEEHAHAHNHGSCLLKFYLQAFIISINIGSIFGILYSFYNFLFTPFDPQLLVALIVGGFLDGFAIAFASLLVLMVVWSLWDAILLVFSRILFYARIWGGVVGDANR